MPKAKNIKPLLLTLANSAKAENKKKIQELIGLWEDRKIPNYKTVQNLALKLASTHKATLKSADKQYDELVANYKSKPSMTGRLKSKTQPNLLPTFSEVVARESWKSSFSYRY